MTLPELLHQSAAAHPAKAAIVAGARAVTYGALAAEAASLAAVLRGCGLRPDERVVMMLPNGPEFVATYFAIQEAGGTVVPANILFKPDEVRHLLQDSGASLAVTVRAFAPTVRAAAVASAGRQPAGRARVLILDGEEGTVVGPDLTLAEGRRRAAFAPAPAAAAAVAACLYTSGTTGRPKGALLTHANILANIAAFGQVIRCGPEDVFCCVLPLFHSFAATVMMLFPLSIGATVVVEPRFAPDSLLRTLGARRCTVFAGVPAMYALLASLPEVPADLSALRLCVSGGAPLPVEVLRRFEARYGIPIYEGYGPTECSPALTVNPPFGKRKVGSVGLPLPGVEIRVVDERGAPVPVGEVGEVIAKGPNVMLGYLNRPEETAAVLRDGWFHTGDLGCLDAEGYLTIVDRKKDMLIVGGLNVYPREVETVLEAHPAVAEAAVIGLPDPVKGEQPVAFVVRRPGESPAAPDLLRYLRERLAPFKVPKRITFLDTLPRNATGKVLKQALKAQPR
ncbi:MAG: long-chain fatty acid--CoA ligase [candidate division NC10 bacterium]|nr:long-chain fatty acid--CoA ligase [candidate division NC10 bacterium]